MSRSNPRVNPKAKPPAIPDIPHDVPLSLRAVLMGMKENIQLLNWGGGTSGEITRIQQSITHLNEITVNVDNSTVEDSPIPTGVEVTCLPTRLAVSYTAPTNTGHSYTELYLQFSDTVADADGNLTAKDSADFSDDRIYALTQGRAFNVPLDMQYNRGIYIWLRHVNRVGHQGELYAHSFIVIPLAATQILETIEGQIDFTDLNDTSQKKITDIEDGLASTDTLVDSHTSLINDITKEDGDIATAITAYNTKITADDGAIATAVDTLETTITGAGGSIETAVNALETKITGENGSIASAIDTYNTTLTSDDGAIATQVNALETKITGENGSIASAIDTYNTTLTADDGAIATTVENHSVTVDGQTYTLSDTASVAVQNKSDFSGFWEKSLTSVDGITTNVGLYADSDGKTSFVVKADNLTFVNADKKKFNPFDFDTTTGIAYLTGTVTGSLKIQDSTKTIAHIDDTQALFDVDTFAIKDSTNTDLSFSFAVSDYNYTDSDGNAQTKKVVAMNEVVVKNAVMDAITVTGSKETTGGTTKYSTTLTDVAVLGDSSFAGEVDITSGKITIGSNFSVSEDGTVTAKNAKISGEVEATAIVADTIEAKHIKKGALSQSHYINSGTPPDNPNETHITSILQLDDLTVSADEAAIGWVNFVALNEGNPDLFGLYIHLSRAEIGSSQYSTVATHTRSGLKKGIYQSFNFPIPKTDTDYKYIASVMLTKLNGDTVTQNELEGTCEISLVVFGAKR